MAKNMKELAALINMQIKKSLKEDVGDKVVEVAKKRVQEDVYNVYPDPKVYDRTGKLKESFEVTETNDGIAIENTRRDGDRYIPEIIEYGHDKSEQGYEYAYEYSDNNYLQPRPFIENTRLQVKKENIHVNELKKSLKKNGFDVE